MDAWIYDKPLCNLFSDLFRACLVRGTNPIWFKGLKVIKVAVKKDQNVSSPTPPSPSPMAPSLRPSLSAPAACARARTIFALLCFDLAADSFQASEGSCGGREGGCGGPRRVRRGVQTIEVGVAGVDALRGGERATTLDLAVARGRRRERGRHGLSFWSCSLKYPPLKGLQD